MSKLFVPFIMMEISTEKLNFHSTNSDIIRWNFIHCSGNKCYRNKICLVCSKSMSFWFALRGLLSGNDFDGLFTQKQIIDSINIQRSSQSATATVERRRAGSRCPSPTSSRERSNHSSLPISSLRKEVETITLSVGWIKDSRVFLDVYHRNRHELQRCPHVVMDWRVGSSCCCICYCYGVHDDHAFGCFLDLV